MERDLLIYQPDRPVDADKRLYRVAWYGGESTQLHFQKWCLIVATVQTSMVTMNGLTLMFVH